MLAYRLRHRVAIQEKIQTQSPKTGGVTHTWQTLVLDWQPMDSIPAEVLTGPGREFRQSGATQADFDLRVNMRWFPGLKRTHRILWQGEPYNIVSIETDVTNRRDYYIKCQGGLTDGQ